MKKERKKERKKESLVFLLRALNSELVVVSIEQLARRPTDRPPGSSGERKTGFPPRIDNIRTIFGNRSVHQEKKERELREEEEKEEKEGERVRRRKKRRRKGRRRKRRRRQIQMIKNVLSNDVIIL